MLQRNQQKKRRGSVLVEYALLIAGIAIVSTVGVAVVGHNVADQFAVMAGILPGAHPEDNLPIQASEVIPFTDNGGVLVLDGNNLVTGADRLASIGTGSEPIGELLVVGGDEDGGGGTP